MNDRVQQERTEAWIGDAVLCLFARQWLLEQSEISADDREEAFMLMTSNQFLTARGNPTAMEAEIGKRYQRDGLEVAFQMIEDTWVPIFHKQWKNRKRNH